MSTILVLGGSHSDQPLIQSALVHGLKVITTGNVPDHPGHQISNAYTPGDYSNPEEMLEISRRIRPDFIVPGANDFAMLSASFVAEKMGLIGYDPYHVTKALHHKHEFKQLASSISMSITPYEIFPSTKLPTLGHLRFPLLIKPVDLTGGKGISRIDNISQLPGAITKAKEQSHQDLLIAEEWFDGSLHSYSTIIKDQKIIFEYFDSEFCLYHDFLVSTSISSAPTDNQVRQGLANEVSRLIKELQLVDGVLHCQYLLGDSGYRILEFTRRMSGDLYSTVVQGVRGIRHSDVFIGSSIGAQVTDYLTPVQSQSPFISRHCITAQGTGQFSGLSIDPGLRPNLVSLTLARPLGSALNSDGLGKAAVAILSFESEAEMRRFALTCKDSMRCEINP